MKTTREVALADNSTQDCKDTKPNCPELHSRHFSILHAPNRAYRTKFVAEYYSFQNVAYIKGVSRLLADGGTRALWRFSSPQLVVN